MNTYTFATDSHTPGPWESWSPHPGQYAIVPEGKATHFESWTLAYVRDFQAQDRANAALMASAPELLEALKALLAIAENQLDQSATHDGMTNCDILSKSRAAIAKAKGESCN